MTEDEMIGWHHQFNEHELGQTLGDGEGQRGLVCCSLWSQRVGHDLMPEQQQQSHPGLGVIVHQNQEYFTTHSKEPLS